MFYLFSKKAKKEINFLKNCVKYADESVSTAEKTVLELENRLLEKEEIIKDQDGRISELLTSNAKSEEDIKSYCQEQANNRIKREKEEMCEIFAKKISRVFKMSLEELKNINVMSVWQDTDEKENKLDTWTMYTGICSYGGCDMSGITYPDEITAYRAAVAYTIINGGPNSRGTCSSCYAEYRENCI